MKKKVVCLMLVVAAMLVGNAAGAVIWSKYAGVGTDQSWTNANNWWDNVALTTILPTTATDVYIRGGQTGGASVFDEAIVNTDGAAARIVRLGDTTSSPNYDRPALLTVTAGTLTARQFIIGSQPAALSGIGWDKMTISGGAVIQNVASQHLILGGHSAATAIGKGWLDMTGGAFTRTTGTIQIGYYGTGKLTMSGNAVLTSDSSVAVNIATMGGSNGLLQISDNAVLTAGVLNVGLSTNSTGTAFVDVFGGTLNLTDIVFAGNAANKILITNGIIKISGDKVAAMDAFITSGKIWTNVAGGTVDAYLGTGADAGKTIIQTIIPEPATMAILGLGSLALLKRRK